MSRRGVPEGPLGGLGARGARARVAPVDEAAMQAKLRELRSVMAKERTARTEMHSAMEANGGRIWSSSKPTTLRSRDGGLKLRELTAEELERIQRAKDRAAASDRAAAIAAVTAGRARSRSWRRVLDPLDKSVEPMGEPEPANGRAFRRAGNAEVMTFGDDDDSAAVVANETLSLLEGTLDQAANRAAFAEALREWRGGKKQNDEPESKTEKENSAQSRVWAGGSLLDGAIDGAANRRAFAEALNEWRGEPNVAAKKKSKPTERSATETQTETPAGAAGLRNARPPTAKPSAPPGASYFERLRFGNVERLAGWDAADAVRRGSGKGRQ